MTEGPVSFDEIRARFIRILKDQFGDLLEDDAALLDEPEGLDMLGERLYSGL